MFKEINTFSQVLILTQSFLRFAQLRIVCVLLKQVLLRFFRKYQFTNIRSTRNLIILLTQFHAAADRSFAA